MNLLHVLDILSWQTAFYSLALLFFFNIIHILWTAFYNLYLHPPRNFPGPKLWIAFPILRSLSMTRGELDYIMKDLHDKYGHVVRSTANELSFINAQAWKDIYGFGHAELPKYSASFASFNGQEILSSNVHDHFRFRRAMLPAFTDASLAKQEPLITVYVDLLMERLREVAASGQPTDIVQWYNFTTLDLIGDLAYGESFNGLSEQKSNVWLTNIKNMFYLMPILALMSVSPLVGYLMQFSPARKSATVEPSPSPPSPSSPTGALIDMIKVIAGILWMQ